MKRTYSGICSVPGCGQTLRARGLCNRHYLRQRNRGILETPEDRIRPDRVALHAERLRFLNEVVLVYEGDDCLTGPFSRYNYGYAKFNMDGRRVLLSREVCRRVHGEPPTPLHQAAHSCGKGHLGCINPNHLSWKTRKENEADKLIHGTHIRGERHASAKLTEQDVLQIMALLKKGVTHRSIAADFKISRPYIGKILRGERWGWLVL